MVIRGLTIAGWLLCLQANAATTATAALELTTKERDRLGQLACRTAAESIAAIARGNSPPGDYVDVQCKPHSAHHGHEVSDSARCFRPSNDADWHCEPPIATVRVEAAGRNFQVRHAGITTDLAVRAMAYLLSGPTSGKLYFDPAWLDSVAWVSASPGHIAVTSGSHVASLRVLGRGHREFELQQITHCDNDTCVPQ
jgi:hypothetical protein